MSAIRKQALIELLTLPYTCKQRDIICGQTKVETQNLASHKQGCAINRCDYAPAITALFARETQGWAINKCDYAPVITAFFARETQGGVINKCYYMPVIAALFARETQNLASLLG